MYDVCMDSLPYLISSICLAIVIVRGWHFFTGLVTGGE